MTDITSGIETITPQDAERLLGTNTNNRSVNRRQVELFARAMGRGEWKVNGEAVKIGADGRLLDGQHRLLACVRSGVPLTTLVVRGLPDETQQTMDSGKTRTLGNVLQLRGETSATNLASITRSVYLADLLGVEAAALNDMAPTRGELVEFLDRTPQLRTVMTASQSFSKTSHNLLTPGMFAALWWTLAHVDTDDANRFFSGLATGVDLNDGSPILVLRNTLLERRGRRSDRDARRRIAALTVKAWNKWRAGDTVRMLRFGVDERFPEPK